MPVNKGRLALVALAACVVRSRAMRPGTSFAPASLRLRLRGADQLGPNSLPSQPASRRATAALLSLRAGNAAEMASGDVSKCPFFSASLKVSAAVGWARPFCASSIQVAAFVLVFAPLLLPLFLANLRLAAVMTLALLQIPMHSPRFNKYLAVGLVGAGLKSLRFLQCAGLGALASVATHPLTLTLSFPPALLLTSEPLLVTLKKAKRDADVATAVHSVEGTSSAAEDLTQFEEEGEIRQVGGQSEDELVFAKGTDLSKILADATSIALSSTRPQ